MLVQPLPSVTSTVMGNVPVSVGVPLNTPAADNVSPFGNVPLLRLKSAPPTAPVCVKVSLKDVPVVPVLLPGLITSIDLQLITKLYVPPVPVQPLPSVTFTVMGKVPVSVGVPLSTPAVDKLKPFGSDPELRVKVAPPIAPLCVKVLLKAVPTGPELLPGLVTVMV